MNSYIRELTQAQLGYIAAAFDGEGTIGVYRSKHKTQQLYYYAQAHVHNTNIDFLRWLRNTTFVGVISPRKAVSLNHKSLNVWKLSYADMAYLLPKILPYLVIKDEQAKVVLRFLELPSGNQNRPKTLEESEVRQELYWRTRALNERGPGEEN